MEGDRTAVADECGGGPASSRRFAGIFECDLQCGTDGLPVTVTADGLLGRSAVKRNFDA